MTAVLDLRIFIGLVATSFLMVDIYRLEWLATYSSINITPFTTHFVQVLAIQGFKSYSRMFISS